MSQGMTHKYSDNFLKTTTCNKSLLFFPDFDKASEARTCCPCPVVVSVSLAVASTWLFCAGVVVHDEAQVDVGVIGCRVDTSTVGYTAEGGIRPKVVTTTNNAVST